MRQRKGVSACLTWSAYRDERGALLRIGRQIDAALRLIGAGVIAARIDALAALAARLVVAAMDAVRTVLRRAFVHVLLAHIDGCWLHRMAVGLVSTAMGCNVNVRVQ